MKKQPYLTFEEYLEDELINDKELKEEWDNSQSELNILRAVLDARIKLNMTQKELADRCQMDQADISKIERGILNPSVKQLKKIAKGLNKKLKIEFVD